MKTDRVNQFLVTICVLVVLVTQFQSRQVIERERYLVPDQQPLGETFNDPALDEPKYGLLSRFFSRRRVVQQQCQPQQSQRVSNPYQLPNCPDGNCPQPNVQPSGNSGKLVPQPNCPDGKCPLVPASSIEKKKTGMVRCSCCAAVIVGNDLHTEWTDSGEPISPCCDDCWQKMTREQRMNSVERWARAAGITDEATLTRYKGAVK